MRTHPVSLRLEGRPCVVLGGDQVATAKAESCLQAGATVTVVALSVTPALAGWIAGGRMRHEARGYRPGDLAGAVLAYAVTCDPEVIASLVAEATRERVWLNVVDMPAACSFFAPAVVARGDLQIAVGTGGASPALAAHLRRTLDSQFGPEYGPFVAILGAVRRALADDPTRAPVRGEVVTTLLFSPLLDLVRRGERDGVDALLARVAGPECTLAALGVPSWS